MNAGLLTCGACLIIINLVLAALSIRVSSSEPQPFPPLPTAAEAPTVSPPSVRNVTRENDPGLRSLFVHASPTAPRKDAVAPTPLPQEQLALRLLGIMSIADQGSHRVAVVEYGPSRRIARLRAGEVLPGTDVAVVAIARGEVELREGGIYRKIKLN